MYERLDKLREEVKRCEKRRDEANERLKAAQTKLKEAEASQILSDVGAMKFSTEEVAKLLQLATSGQLPVPGAAGSTVTEVKTDPIYTGSSAVTEDEEEYKEDKEDEDY